MILKNNFFKLMNSPVFGKNYGKCEKTQRYKTCHNSEKKKLFGVRTKLSYYKVFHRKRISNRNDRNRDTYE